MPTFIILIILSFAMFIYYRIRAWQIHAPYKKKWTVTKANMGLGAFMFFFGLNRLFIQASALSAIVCGVFILYGLFIIYYSIKAYRYYWPRMVEESRRSVTSNGQ
ncbi:YtpI family protein [Tuberibacillus calidus]|uniref:YtpI family protein n=1 Tax=Tuberibacillus calidus TaxID=340097 RepID=UPI0003F56CCC|nr:YtpI family protein [Tuberibacillus calidus]